MKNRHTCTICSLNLLLAIVAFTNREAINIISNMICGTGITVPVRINIVACIIVDVICNMWILGLERMIKPIIALQGNVPCSATDLTQWTTTTIARIVAIAMATIVVVIVVTSATTSTALASTVTTNITAATSTLST